LIRPLGMRPGAVTSGFSTVTATAFNI
jgi:hypothetical protein